MPIEEMRKRIEELRNNLVRVLGRIHELEGFEDFADSIQLVIADNDTFDTISIEPQDSAFTLTIDAVGLK